MEAALRLRQRPFLQSRPQRRPQPLCLAAAAAGAAAAAVRPPALLVWGLQLSAAATLTAS
jgi:hypothetical protein